MIVLRSAMIRSSTFAQSFLHVGSVGVLTERGKGGEANMK